MNLDWQESEHKQVNLDTSYDRNGREKGRQANNVLFLNNLIRIIDLRFIILIIDVTQTSNVFTLWRFYLEIKIEAKDQ